MNGTIRQRLTVSVVAVTAVMLTLLVLGFNFSLRSSLDADVNRLLEARAQAALESVNTEDGKVEVNETADGGAENALAWVYANGVVVEHPQVGGKLDAVAAALAAKGEGQVDDSDGDTRLYALPIVEKGVRIGTVVSGLSLEPYERTADRAAIASVVLALIMIVLTSITTRLVVGRALKPVATMTEEAANWSEHDLDRRFNEGTPNDELTRLAATFDSMLDRLAFMVRHERNFSAELSHELRTPLSAISAEAEIALGKERGSSEYRESLQRISERSDELTRILETLLDVSRSEGGAMAAESVEAGSVINATVDGMMPLAESYGIEVGVKVTGQVQSVQVGPETFRRIFAPVFENALTYAHARVTIQVVRSSRIVEVTVSDDGPGFGPEEVEVAFEPGQRGSAERNAAAPTGTGLGLALARRLARANGGDVTIALPGGAGGSVTISLPESLDQNF
ncbi:MAG: HAMP domain-containing protein [Solirubrobacterales bacterium]|nr:HAMP domain-containing protein [Solirubrobacterales bacterium]